eukprot:scaffold1352_cov144-Cylindrotheca_fusiformis.AAC.12
METVQCRGDGMNIAGERAGETVTEPGNHPIVVRWKSSRSNLMENAWIWIRKALHYIRKAPVD